MDDIRSHPAYHAGFFDALDSVPLFDGAAPEYKAGWNAAWASKKIFEDAGFSQTARSFRAVATLTR